MTSTGHGDKVLYGYTGVQACNHMFKPRRV